MNTGLGFNITANDREFLNALNRSGRAVNTFSNNVISEGDRIELMFNKMSRAAGMFGISFGVKELISKTVQVRNQFQQLEIAFGTMLKSTEKATKLMSELQTFAANTPFGLESASSGAKQLIAYGSKAEDVIKEMTMLGDVAAGTGQQIGDLVYLYGTLRMQGRAYLMDIRQFAGRGIPIYAELAKVLGVAEGKVNELVSAGKVGFPEVEQAFKNMTTAGGMYGGLMAEQSKSIGGRWEELKDNIDAVFNSIGKSSEGIIYSSMDGLNLLVANYEKLGKVLLALVATYGAYRTAIILNNVIMRVQAEMALQAALANATLTTSQQLGAVASRQWSAALSILNKVMLANPYVAVTVAIIGLVATMWALRDSTTGAEKAQADLNKIKEEAAQKEEEHRNEIEKLITSSTNQALADLERTDALEKLKQKYPQIFAKYDIETLKLADILSIKKQIAEIDSGEKVKTNKSDYDKAKAEADKATKYYNSLKNTNAAWQGYDIALADAKNKMDYANKILEDHESKVQNDRINSFISGINKMTDTQIKAELAARQRLQAEMQYKDAKLGTTKGGVLDGDFNADQIKQQTDALTAELNKRKLPVKSYIEWEKQYNSDLKILQDKRKKIEQNDAKLSEDQLKKQLEDIDSKIKAKQDEIKTLKGKTSKQEDAENKKNIKDAEKAQKISKEESDLRKKLTNEAIQAELDNEQALLDLKKDSYEKQFEQNDLNYRKELQKIKEFNDEKLKEQADFIEKFGKKALPEELETKYIDEQTNKKEDQAYASWSNNSNNIAKLQRKDVFDDALEEYRTFEEKQNKIALKYIDLRAKAMESGNLQLIENLNKAEKKETSALSLDDFKEKINWEQVFGDLDKVSTDALKDLRDKLREYLQAAGDNINIQDLKAVSEAIEGIDEKLANKQPLTELKEGYADYKRAIDDVAKAKANLNSLEENDVNYVKYKKDLANAENARVAALKKMSKSINDAGRKGTEIVNAGNDILDMLNDFGVEVPEQFQKALEGVGQMMSGLESIDLTKPFSIISGSVKTITGLGKTVAGIFGMFGGGDNKQYIKLKEQYDRLNAVWDQLIDKKKEYLSISYGEEAVRVGKEAESLVEKSIESYRKLGKSFLNSFQNKGGKSWGVRQQGRIDSDDWADLEAWKKNNNISDSLYSSVTTGRMTGLFDLTAEQLERLKEEAPTLWAKLNDETKEYLQNIIDGSEKIEDIQKSVKEAVTGITFDSLKDSLDDLVKSADTIFSDVGDSFNDHMRTAALKFTKSSYLTNALQDWYDKFAEYAESGSTDDTFGLTSGEKAELQKMYEEAYNKAQSLYDSALDAMGVSKENSDINGITGVAASITQDSANEINANFYALRQSVNDIRNINKQNQDYLKIQNGHLSDVKDAVNSYKQVFNDQLEFQRQIAANTAATTSILREIRDNGISLR
ncbi:tape measure protein [Dysgonomonas macrotermitis]|uniref:Tape measure protein N-terminal domain-containing protein n=1 Tax=Dysgonomonas macrotermitis TaxID=1346286 RepID=A0A1M5IU14_9BACT|nr:tape measure protein [Dysgonomonas macrotermitis]SHG31655.1 hypothetical protein SAMN05444362_12114 [Dysgonomonas macrotermitis]